MTIERYSVEALGVRIVTDFPKSYYKEVMQRNKKIHKKLCIKLLCDYSYKHL